MPAFSHRARPLANMAAFQRHASFGFWYRERLATGREGEAMGQFGRIESLADLPDEAAMKAQVPEALAEALARDPLAAGKFDALEPVWECALRRITAPARSPAQRAARLLRVDRRRQAGSDARQAPGRRDRLDPRGKKRHWKYESH